MAPTKRPRPSFSPPRPGKAKRKSTSTTSNVKDARSKTSKSASTIRKNASESSSSVPKSRSKNPKYKGRKGTLQALLSDDDDDDEEEEEEEAEEEEGDNNRLQQHRHRSRGALDLVDDEAPDDEGDEDEAEDDDDDEEVDEEEADSALLRSSPGPDMILAEITNIPPSESNGNSESPIPEQLVHKMLAHHFERPDKTKISADARDLVARYIEVFLREAVMRSDEERKEREGRDTGGGGGGGGFLELEDLERAAVQLCLDF